MTLEINIYGLQDKVQVTEVDLSSDECISYQLEPARRLGKLHRISPEGAMTLMLSRLYIWAAQRLILTTQPGHQLTAESGPDKDLIQARHPDGSTRELTLHHYLRTQNRTSVNMGALGGYWAVRAVNRQ